LSDLDAQTHSPVWDFLRALRDRKFTVLLITLLVTGAALAISFTRPNRYSSESQVLVKPVSVSGGQAVAPEPPNMNTEQRVADSLAVAQMAAETLEAPDAKKLQEDLGVSVPPETEVIVFSFTAATPEQAQAGAGAFADAYLTYRRRQVLADLLAVANALKEQESELNTQLTEINAEIAAETDPDQLVQLQNQANSLVGQIALLQQRMSDVTPTDNLRVGQLIEDPELPESPSSPKPLLAGILGLVIGLTLASGVAFVRDRLDERIRDVSDVEVALGASILSLVPSAPEWKGEGSPPLLSRDQPHSSFAEAFRRLRTGVLFAASAKGAHVLLVTSAHPGEGKSTTTANLGVTLARAGKRVVLISADLRRPRVHEFFGSAPRTGLTNVLAGETTVANALVSPGIQNLRLLHSGPIPGNPAEILGSLAMRELVETLKAEADFVIIDTPPILSVADALTLAHVADAVLIVVDGRSTTVTDVTQTRRQLDQIDARVIGAVLNNFDHTKARVPYYYSHYYGEPKEAAEKGTTADA
jgi:capsular exopolysaccharide synthesis family protein